MQPWSGRPGASLGLPPSSPTPGKCGQGQGKLGEGRCFVCRVNFFFFCPQITQVLLGKYNHIYSSFNVFYSEILGRIFFPLILRREMP